MSGPLVVDSNVVIKWLLLEEHSPNALALRDDSIQSGDAMIVPPLLSSEITNALYQRERRGMITPVQANESLGKYFNYPLHVVAPDGLYTSALALARRHNLKATYDAQYLAVAQDLGIDLWTADEKLVRSLPRSMDWVRWIGDYVSQD